jgi:hypothetical protein
MSICVLDTQAGTTLGLSQFLSAQYHLVEGTPLAPILEPRRTLAPPGYHSTKCVSAGLFLLLGESRLKDRLGLPIVPTEITAHTVAYQVIKYGVRTFFVQEEFARAVAATDLPHDFTLDDLHWPLAGMVVGFPPRFMQEYLGRDLCYVYAANCDAGNYSVAALQGCPTITVPRSKVAWWFYAWRDGNLECFASSYLREDRVDETIAKHCYTDYTGLKDEFGVQADKEMTDRLSGLMLKLLVVLNTRPSLVEQGCCVRPERIKHGRVKQHQLWSPNLIGWRYQAAVERGGNGTHASPRLHWRRGHVRRQPYGAGRGQRKLIWIEPVLVGAGVVDGNGNRGIR